jgi:hypothetical protein
MQRRVETQDFFDQLRCHLTIGAWQERFERIALAYAPWPHGRR